MKTRSLAPRISVGKYSGSGYSECVDCDAGYYQDAAGQSSCVLSTAGSYTDTAGASEMTPCAVGKFSGSAATACENCKAGTYLAGAFESQTCSRMDACAREHH